MFAVLFGANTSLEERLAQERHSAVEQEDPRLGRVVADRYELMRGIGLGVLGSLYEARHTSLGRMLTLELVDAELIDREAVRERFKGVLQTLSRVRHRGIIEIESFGVDTDGSLYIVTKRLDAPRLHEVIDRERRLPWARARGLVLQLAAALDAAHRRSVMHGGLRPEACYVVGTAPGAEQVIVTEFALAEIAQEMRFAANAKGATTRLAGDPRYLPLEQFISGRSSIPADVYSLGAMLYHVLTGEPPYSGVNAFHALHQRRSRAVVPPRELEPSIPVEVEVVVMHALAVEPGSRYATARELATALEAVPADVAAVIPSPRSDPEPRSGPSGSVVREPMVVREPALAPRPIVSSPVPTAARVVDLESMVPTTHMVAFPRPASAEDDATVMMARHVSLPRAGGLDATTMLEAAHASLGPRSEQTTVLGADELRIVPLVGISEPRTSEATLLPPPMFEAVPSAAAPPSYASALPSVTPSAPRAQVPVPVLAQSPAWPPLPAHSSPSAVSPSWSARTWLLVLGAVLVMVVVGACIGLLLVRTSTKGGNPPEEPSSPTSPMQRKQP